MIWSVCSDQRAAQVSKAGQGGEPLRCPKTGGGGARRCPVGVKRDRTKKARTHAHTTTEAQLDEVAGSRLERRILCMNLGDSGYGFKYYMRPRRRRRQCCRGRDGGMDGGMDDGSLRCGQDKGDLQQANS